MEYNVIRFKNLLIDENTRHNLVSRKNTEKEVDKHIEDSLMVLDFISLEGKKVLDIGSGAGFPGLVLALYCPGSRFSLLEASIKKASFLKKVKTELELENTDILCRRVEELGQDIDFREKFDICTCRGVAAMNILLEYGLPLLHMEGKMIMWKGRNFEREIGLSENALKILGGKIVDVFSYNLMGERDRALVVVQKKEMTADRYPRRVGIPEKRPL
jgi:16S rRNA (guanine527-N7)-methyltransferase